MFKNVYSLVNIHLNMVPRRYQVMYKISGNSLTSLLATTQGPRVIFHKNPFSLRTILRPQVPLIKFSQVLRPQLPITKYQLWLDKFLKKPFNRNQFRDKGTHFQIPTRRGKQVTFSKLIDRKYFDNFPSYLIAQPPPRRPGPGPGPGPPPLLNRTCWLKMTIKKVFVSPKYSII